MGEKKERGGKTGEAGGENRRGTIPQNSKNNCLHDASFYVQLIYKFKCTVYYVCVVRVVRVCFFSCVKSHACECV